MCIRDSFEHLLELVVNCADVVFREPSECDSALIGNDDHAQACSLHRIDGFDDPRQHLEVAPLRHPFAFRHLLVDDAVSVEEYGFQEEGSWDVGGVEHTVMIATGDLLGAAWSSRRRSHFRESEE